jgi:tetratricopeptide (TPR) repeat protein
MDFPMPTRPSPHYSLACTGCLCLGLALAVACGGSDPAPKSAAEEQAEQSSAVAFFERGKRLAEAGDSVRAEQYLSAAVRKGYPMEQVLPWLMQVCLSGSRLRSALNYALPYLDQHPEALELRQVVATIHLSLGQPLEARDQLLTILAQDANAGDAQYLLGLTEWEGFGNKASAREHFQRYLELVPSGRHARAARAWLLRYPEPVASPEPIQPSEAAPGARDTSSSSKEVSQ